MNTEGIATFPKYVNKSRLLLALLLLLFNLQVLAVPSDLVTTAWIQKHLQQIKLIDLRAADVYEQGHLPQAINIPYKLFSRKKDGIDGFVISPARFRSLMESYGISNHDTVVLYSDWSFLDSMRVYWIFDFYGHQKVKVLDGGIQQWQAEGLALSRKGKKFPPASYTVSIKSQILSTKLRTFLASKNDEYIIVDGRDPDQYNGLESLTERKGHIPGAINIPWVDLVANRTVSDKFKKIKTPSTLEDLNTIQKRLSVIPKDKKIILYCNGGQESAVLYFSLKALGVRAALYDGSWFEWSRDKKMPIE